MAGKKGKLQYDRWQMGKELTRKESMLAMCYQCNGLEESDADCLGKNCPLYAFQPYRIAKLGQNSTRPHITVNRSCFEL